MLYTMSSVLLILLVLLSHSATALLITPPTVTAIAVGFRSAALGILLAITPLQEPPQKYDFEQISQVQNSNTVPVLEVIKVYGKLAGRECYGKQAPEGSSCQINLQDLQKRLTVVSPSTATTASTMSSSILSRDDFATQLEQLDFQWPLKPFGVDQSPSLIKTATMNKGAETRVYLQELEARGILDPRNPTGPLPSSLRPILNGQLQLEGILEPRVVDRTYQALTSRLFRLGEDDGMQQETTEGLRIDYYQFLEWFGPNSIVWPS